MKDQSARPADHSPADHSPAGEQPGPDAVAGAGELLRVIGIVRRTGRRTARQAWPEDPLPSAQSELLLLAIDRPGLTVAEAARELRLAPNTVSTLVGRLARADLLVRSRSDRDGRAALLTATDRAVARIAGYRDLRAALAARALARLPASDQHILAAAAPALLRLAEHMEAL